MTYMNYKDYIAHVEYDDEAEIFHGEIINTQDVITFQGATVKELKKSFADSIEDYLAFCEERGEEPNRPFSGKFNLRIEPDLHRKVFIQAKTTGKSLNEWVKDVIISSLEVAGSEVSGAVKKRLQVREDGTPYEYNSKRAASAKRKRDDSFAKSNPKHSFKKSKHKK